MQEYVTAKVKNGYIRMSLNVVTKRLLSFVRKISSQPKIGQCAREIQVKRFGDGKIMANARMTHKQVRKFCELDQPCEMMLKQAMTEFGLSARAHDKICKVARTIADLAGVEGISPEHVAEAISYRKLDRKL